MNEEVINEPTKQKSHKFLYAIIILLAVALVGVLIYNSWEFEDTKREGNSNLFKYAVIKADIYVNWIGEPIESKFEVFDVHFNLLESYHTHNLTIMAEEEKKIYVKVTYTATFNEGGTETTYIWVLLHLDPKSDNTLEMPIDLKPAVWKEEPDLRW